VSPIPDEGGLGAVGGTLPHAVAIESATVRAIVRLLAMARTSYQPSHPSAEWPVEAMMADESDAPACRRFRTKAGATSRKGSMRSEVRFCATSQRRRTAS
jgi:hypothetical protein